MKSLVLAAASLTFLAGPSLAAEAVTQAPPPAPYRRWRAGEAARLPPRPRHALRRSGDAAGRPVPRL